MAGKDGDVVPDRLTADICIVGSGPSGQAVARALSACEADVLVVEAGGVDDDRWGRRYASAAMPSRGRQYPNAGHQVSIRLGGTSDRWAIRLKPNHDSGSGIRIHRLDPVDFEKRPTPGADGWPITGEALEPHYRDAEAMFGLRSDQTTDSAPINDNPHVVEKTLWAVDRRCFDEPDLGSATVVTNCLVTTLEASPTGRITGATAVTRDGRSIRISAGIFVLAMGTVQTTRLLLDSPWSEARSIANSSDQLGRQLTDHPQLSIGQLALRHGADLAGIAHLAPSVEPGNVLRWPNLATSALRSRDPDVARLAATLLPMSSIPRTQALRNRFRRPQGTRTAALNTAAELADGMRRRPPDWSSFRKLPQLIGGVDEIAQAFWADHGPQPAWSVEDPHWRHLGDGDRNSAGASDKPAGFQIFGIAEQLPSPENRIVLSDQRNGLGGRRALIDWRWSAEDQRRVETTADDIRDMLERLGIGDILARRERASIHKINSHHASGTTRMSESPETGVVDPNLRAHDHPNLYIVGSSVFNSNGFANPTLTNVALGIRLGHHLATCHR